jgi:CTP:molybdopterin cytidylyltransferase MocA
MRAGEQSAAQAFARIIRRLTPGKSVHASHLVAHMIADEERHDVLLSDCSAALPEAAADTGARRFFRRMQTRAMHFEAPGVDSDVMIRCIERDG